MKTTFSIDILRRPSRSCHALTILEMLVSTAMLAFIVLGLTAMFIQTQKAFKTGIKQTSVTDAGRAIVDMMAADFSQLSDPHFTNVYFPTNGLGSPPALNWALVPGLQFSQNINGSSVPRTNQSEDIFITVQTNNTWLGIGYTVSNWFTNSGGGAFAGVGTLYRYVASTNAPLNSSNQLFTNFNNQIGFGTFTNTLFHRIADGVVHLKITAYDADGNETYWEPNYERLEPGKNPFADLNLQYPVIVPDPVNFGAVLTNYLPHSIDIELGILEPEAFEHARALFTAGAIPAAGQYLANAGGQVEIFRQHIIISAAPYLTAAPPP